MHPIRTPSLDGTYRGNGEDVGDLPFRRDVIVVNGGPMTAIAAVWTLSEREREQIANGANIELRIIGMEPIPPTEVLVTEEREIE